MKIIENTANSLKTLKPYFHGRLRNSRLSGKPLDYESCKDSYLKAKEFFKKRFNDKPIPFICWSWLVNPNNKLFMKENSNILTFASDYDIIDVVEYKDYNAIAPWLFGKSRVDDLSRPITILRCKNERKNI